MAELDGKSSIEIWKDIEGYEGLYQVSDQGRIKSLPRKGTSGKILLPQKDKDGYCILILFKNGKHKNQKIHRLVAQAFIPNPDSLSEVNHINEDKTDNRACNLNWMSHKENANWGTKIKRTVEKKSKPVKQIRLDGEVVAIWPSATEAGKNGFIQTKITACCRGREKTHFGYRWTYLI